MLNAHNCMGQQKSYAFLVPDYALYVINALEDAGFEAWAVGGWVRDALLKRKSHDIDIASSALWQEAESVLLRKGFSVHRTGVKHGTISVIVDNHALELTTYRTESRYSDRRHPDRVHFVREIAADLARRDFTINALAYHPRRGLFDPYHGIDDLQKGLIRCVGDPKKRFSEDALRVLRAVRFACQLGFSLEDKTQAALREKSVLLKDIAQERIGQELSEIVSSGRQAWALLNQTEVMIAAIPELQALCGFDQKSCYHAFDVLEHTARVCRAVEEFSGGIATDALRWAALFHDIAKPECFSLDSAGHGHFFGHPRVGANMAKKILKRLALPQDLMRKTCLLIKNHDVKLKAHYLPIRSLLSQFEKELPGSAFSLFFQLLDLQRADALAKVRSAARYVYVVNAVENELRAEHIRKTPLKTADLAVNGKDVMREMGYSPGPAVGMVLEGLLAAVVAGEISNSREVLLEQLRM